MTSIPTPATSASAPHLDTDPRRVVVAVRGHALEVTGRLIPKRAWTTCNLALTVDGLPVIETGGVPQATGTKSARVMLDGREQTVALTWAMSTGFAFPVTIRVDDEVVLERVVPVRNWPLAFTVPLLLMVGTALAGLAAVWVTALMHR